MKYVFAMMALLLTGCYTCQHPTAPCAVYSGSTGYMVVNNTGVLINVVQDGQVIASKVEPGQVVPIRPVWMRTTGVVVVGYTPAGEYVGSDSYIFSSAVKEIWTVTGLLRPQHNLLR